MKSRGELIYKGHSFCLVVYAYSDNAQIEKVVTMKYGTSLVSSMSVVLTTF